MTQKSRIETACEITCVFVCDESSAAWCDGCESDVPMITQLTAAILEKTDTVTIFRRVETGELHHKLMADGALLVCFSSLLERSEPSAVAGGLT